MTIIKIAKLDGGFMVQQYYAGEYINIMYSRMYNRAKQYAKEAAKFNIISI